MENTLKNWSSFKRLETDPHFHASHGVCVCVCVCEERLWAHAATQEEHLLPLAYTWKICSALPYYSPKSFWKTHSHSPFPSPLNWGPSATLWFFFCKIPHYLHLNYWVWWEWLALNVCMYSNLEFMGFKCCLVSIVMACHYSSMSFTIPLERPPTVFHWKRLNLRYRFSMETWKYLFKVSLKKLLSLNYVSHVSLTVFSFGNSRLFTID